jgi:hypothetical protein
VAEDRQVPAATEGGGGETERRREGEKERRREGEKERRGDRRDKKW